MASAVCSGQEVVNDRVEIPSGTHTAERWLGGRFRLDERISLDDQVNGPCAREARGLSLWKATDQLLSRPVTIYLLPRGPVPRAVTDAVQAAARVSDPRLATIYDTDFDEQCPYIVAEWTPGTHLEDLVLSGPCPPAPGCPPCWTPSPTAACRDRPLDAPLRPQTPAGPAMALRMVQRPSYQLERPEAGPPSGPGGSGRQARHVSAGARLQAAHHAAAPGCIAPAV